RLAVFQARSTSIRQSGFTGTHHGFLRMLAQIVRQALLMPAGSADLGRFTSFFAAAIAGEQRWALHLRYREYRRSILLSQLSAAQVILIVETHPSQHSNGHRCRHGYSPDAAPDRRLARRNGFVG